MAKTTKKKAVKKKAKRKSKAKDPMGQMSLGIYEKIHLIALEHPEFEGGGSGADPDGEAYTYVKAEQVFKAYGDSFRKHNLVLIPKEKEVTELHRMVAVIAAFDIVDIDSSQKVTIMGVGCGHNGFWAANTASTLALKQALLETFSACWPQVAEQAAVLKAEAREVLGGTEKLGEILSKVDELNRFFDKQFENRKGKSNVKPK